MAFKGNRLPFELDHRPLATAVTPYAGATLVCEAFRLSGAAAEVDALLDLKARKRGLRPSELVESLLLLWAIGGERCDDLELLRADEALAELIGHQFPAPQTMRDFLDRFHEEALPLLHQGAASSVPEESSALRALGKVLARTVHYGHERAGSGSVATLDVDATILESSKREALATYTGATGYQPVAVVWAEQDLFVFDEFRDGNVPAGSGNLRVVKRAFEQLPSSVTERYLRGDSALYEQELMDWLDEEKVGYAISADMTRELRSAIEGLDESAWQLMAHEGSATRQWAEVPYVPDDKRHRKNGPVRRYLAIRILKSQGTLFADGSDRRHFAVVTNRDIDGGELLAWHRQKAGTIEHVHDVIANGLAGEALPSKRFGANAAWYRLNAILYNILSILRRNAMPPDLRNARPKRLRFLCFNVLGQVIRHANECILRVAGHALAIVEKVRTALNAYHRRLIPLAGD